MSVGSIDSACTANIMREAQQEPRACDTIPTVACNPKSFSKRYVYVSNLPFEAYEGTIQQAFESEGFKVVSQLQLLHRHCVWDAQDKLKLHQEFDVKTAMMLS